MILKRVVSPTIIDKVKQLESLSKTTLFANSCRLPQFGRTSSSLATVRQCLDSGTISNRTNCLTKVSNINFKYSVSSNCYFKHPNKPQCKGLEAMVTDYARPNVLGPVLPKILHFSLLIASAVTLCGLFVLINNGPGVSRAVKDAWAIGKTPPRNKPIAE
ncbi:Putative succinate dehydrogenase [ubiquinone] cytochrome b small subunit, mitochondrial [Melipona quadrifasciata]|uniref:Putative succinate dehydrogenase [ubiquinone] cytochrome b small subunit, mitochondrial n=1 Tax=Melipona quadrifasciata TaxID=166423 RepID=A0A0N0BH54_9HYME|nr:Putative succinate dehydrogenase [ubiquinone] cytochrome b small subunit, mitochondrial [Melipona quadrifasciata]